MLTIFVQILSGTTLKLTSGPLPLDHSSLAIIHHFLEHPSLDHPSLNHPSVCRLSWPLLLPWLHLALGPPTMDLRRTAQIFVFFRFPHSKVRLCFLSSLLVSQGRTQIIVEVIFNFQNSQMKVCLFKEIGARGAGGKAASPNREECGGSSTTQLKKRKAAPPPKNEGEKQHHSKKARREVPAPPRKEERQAALPLQRRKGVTAPARGGGERHHHPQEEMLLCRPPLGGVAVLQVR